MPLSFTSLRGQLLLDGGKLAGSYFHHTVVLICQHDAGGAFGLVLNRTAPNRVGEVLVANLPETLTSALVAPPPVATLESDDASSHRGVPMRRDDEVEQIAMDIVMRYERSRGWTPFDVSQDGEHYDIRSESPTGEKRFIEVKGRAQSGAIILTGPELDKLSQLGERAFLYVVTYCKGERTRLRVIQDPMAHVTPEALYRQVQYLVDERDWISKGEEVNMP